MLILILALNANHALAHGIDVECKQVGVRLQVEAFFDDNTPARGAKVQILDDMNEVVMSGVTDAQGKCSLRAPNPGHYQLILDAGAGHRKQRAVRVVGTLPPPDGTSSDAQPQTPRRDDLTRFPWERVLMGLGVIALVGGAWWWSRRIARPV